MAIRYIFDRICGRARESIEHNGPQGGPIVVREIEMYLSGGGTLLCGPL